MQFACTVVRDMMRVELMSHYLRRSYSKLMTSAQLVYVNKAELSSIRLKCASVMLHMLINGEHGLGANKMPRPQASMVSWKCLNDF
jgi:hypothetical protein